MRRLSGDQNGMTASSVPTMGWLVVESSERRKRMFLPSAFVPGKTRRRPSGERIGILGPPGLT
jgi:hypothetical protein